MQLGFIQLRLSSARRRFSFPSQQRVSCE